MPSEGQLLYAIAARPRSPPRLAGGGQRHALPQPASQPDTAPPLLLSHATRQRTSRAALMACFRMPASSRIVVVRDSVSACAGQREAGHARGAGSHLAAGRW